MGFGKLMGGIILAPVGGMAAASIFGSVAAVGKMKRLTSLAQTAEARAEQYKMAQVMGAVQAGNNPFHHEEGTIPFEIKKGDVPEDMQEYVGTWSLKPYEALALERLLAGDHGFDGDTAATSLVNIMINAQMRRDGGPSRGKKGKIRW